MSDFPASAGQTPGLEIWRIENLKPEPYPKEDYGKFYVGDSYIVLKTTKKPTSSALIHDLFFWLGEDSSQDEKGVAAYKTVELDEQLGGGATQYREVQAHESELFLQCFKSVEYRKGGVASGFKKVDRDAYETRLLQLKGARAVRVMPVAVAASSLNAGDVFVLDTGKKIYQWNGSQCNKKEKSKALEITMSIKDDEHGGKSEIVVFEQGAESAEFWSLLGGESGVAAAVPDDAKLEKTTLQLIKVSDESGSLKETQIASSAPLKREMLSSSDVFIVDNGAEIFVWIGKGATQDERKGGMARGSAFVTAHGRPEWTRVTKVFEGTETAVFKSNFASWQAPVAAVDFSEPSVAGNVAATRASATAEELSAQMAALKTSDVASSMVDDGSGTCTVYRIEDFEPVELEAHLLGQLFAGDSYIVKYDYEVDGKESTIIYFWQGAQSSQDEKGAAAIHATKMDDELGGAAVQVRVVQGKEPAHFVAIFKGSLVVHSGGRAAGFKNSNESDTYDTDGVSLFQIKGTEPTDTRAVQVPEAAGSLNSGDGFVLLTPSTMFLWIGSASNEAERNIARGVAGKMQGKRELRELTEASEPDAFWEALGGKGEYTTSKELPELAREPMLFLASNSSGNFKVEAVHDFSQADLDEADVFLLDVFTMLFVWIGSEANEQEKTRIGEIAAAYVKSSGYDVDTPIVTVKSGAEPRTFTANFLGWDASKSKKFADPYEAKLAAMLAAQQEAQMAEELAAEEEAERQREAEAAKKAEEEAAAAAKAAEEAKAAEAAAAAKAAEEAKSANGSGHKDPMTYRLPYEELKAGLPDGVDPTRKEQYLDDAEFEKVMGSPRGIFNQMKAWKQQQIKKAVGLF